MSDFEEDVIIFMNKRSFLSNHCFVYAELLNQVNSTKERIYPKWYCDINREELLF